MSWTIVLLSLTSTVLFEQILVCRYAGQQLQWLATKVASSGNTAFLVQLQQAIQDCDKKGGSNASVPRDEDLETFAEIVGTATDADDVESSIGPLLAEI